MRLYRSLIDLSLILVHPHILPVIHPPLLYLSIEHFRVLLLPYLLPILQLLKPLFFSERIHFRLLQQHLFDLHFILFLFIVLIDLFVETLVHHSPVGGLSLLVVDLTGFQLSQILLLVQVVIVVEETLLGVVQGLPRVRVTCHLIHILVVLLHS